VNPKDAGCANILLHAAIRMMMANPRSSYASLRWKNMTQKRTRIISLRKIIGLAAKESVQ
jgi:hypothetical protein